MSRGLNKVMIIGNLGRDPEMRYTTSGRAVTSFTMATSRSWSSPDGERHEETEWFNVIAWGKLAETCKQYLVKGQPATPPAFYMSEEDQEGRKHFSTEIVADRMLILGDRQRPSQTEPFGDTGPFADESEEFPF